VPTSVPTPSGQAGFLSRIVRTRFRFVLRNVASCRSIDSWGCSRLAPSSSRRYHCYADDHDQLDGSSGRRRKPNGCTDDSG
jgi:hypothetical protein